MDENEAKPMRHGYTTGACATATAKAALIALILQEKQTEMQITLPQGQKVMFQLVDCCFTEDMAVATVIKDGGDDPDATHGAQIATTVTWNDKEGIELDGGIGVGRVTKPGLSIPVGEAAINPVPRMMIKREIEAVLEQFEMNRGVKIIVSVPEGEEIAKKTLNSRLGILGGISILGTRGIVYPFSASAYKASIAQAVRVAIHCGCEHIVLSTGGRSEKYGMALYPDLPEEAFVEMGEFVDYALLQCARHKVKQVTLIGMIGKLSKVAKGEMMVHAHKAPVDFTFLAKVAKEAEVSDELVQVVLESNTAAQVADLMLEHQHHSFFEKICDYACLSSLKVTGGGMEIETIMTTLKGLLLGRVKRW
jgi:cobalt-precorrin-5B (C1)-methyltransferase